MMRSKVIWENNTPIRFVISLDVFRFGGYHREYEAILVKLDRGLDIFLMSFMNTFTGNCYSAR